MCTTTTPATYTWIRGQTEEWTLTVVDFETGLPQDLTTVTDVILAIKQYPGENDPALLKLNLGNGGITVVTPQQPSNVGVCNVVASYTQTFAIPAGTYWLDVFVLTSSGKRKCAIPPTTVAFEDPVGTPST